MVVAEQSKGNNAPPPELDPTSQPSREASDATTAKRPGTHGQVARPLPGDANRELTATFCDAFREDPVFAFFFRAVGGLEKRRDLLERIFSSFLRVTSLQGLVFHIGGYASGVLWMPPGIDILTNMFGTGIWKDMLRVPPRLLKRMVGDYTTKADRAKAKYFKGRPVKKCYYVQLAGTRSAHQGQGLLKYSMLPVLAMADREGMPCYLEATREANVPIYERFGFKVTDTFDLTDRTGPTRTYCMAREPGAPC